MAGKGKVSEIARELGRRGGAATKGVTSERKAEAARENGRKGGRPRKKMPATRNRGLAPAGLKSHTEST